jgi:hypothetical protein
MIARPFAVPRMTVATSTRLEDTPRASEHRSELMEDWQLCASMQTPKKIAPLG